MKVVILAGGLGTRLAPETDVKPKPLVEIGERPILWHIMKHYSHFGFKEFVIALGNKGAEIKKYFLDYRNGNSDLTVNLATGDIKIRNERAEDWIVHLVDTGYNTLTGGRVRRLGRWVGSETFMLTYGDGVSTVSLRDLLKFHQSHRVTATITAVRPPARFGGVEFSGDKISVFTEKSQTSEGWINGGFMVLEPEVLDYVTDDNSSLERDVLERLSKEGKLGAYKHDGFWQSMDTPRDLRLLESLWQQGNAPWKIWDA
ncbi:MAG: glucose-1-phosphate cytidylyltransferase [Thaumarchaeota archaeon]|nr:glucose-1-phosphate cytidylyltransferase [Nitrososphaerota archaeon]